VPEVLLGTIGNLYPTKGFEYLIDATKYLIDNGLNLATVIIGQGPEQKRLADWVSQNRLEKNVYLTGRINEAAKLLPAFDIYVCSSLKEGLSYTLIEAMQAGVPVVATRVGGNPELVEENKTGLLVEPANAEKLANAIIKLLGDSKLQQEFSRNATKKAQEEFSLEKMVNNTKQVYLN
jgi:glycosyltransferase involved in cell wall biosynthesis